MNVELVNWGDVNEYGEAVCVLLQGVCGEGWQSPPKGFELGRARL